MCRTDDALLTQMFECYHALLVRYLTRMTRCPQRAEDLAQVAWLKLLGACSRGGCAGLDEPELRAYLFTIARNAFLDEYTRKHEAVRTCCVDPDMFDTLADPGHGGMAPEESLEQQQSALRVRRALATLPAEQRRVILMWVRGTSIKDMAASCHAPADTVLSRKKYGFARLRARLGDPTPLAR
jgi:RNA polymerase sigma-70 factor (ECF subfamily)